MIREKKLGRHRLDIAGGEDQAGVCTLAYLREGLVIFRVNSELQTIYGAFSAELSMKLVFEFGAYGREQNLNGV